MPDGRDTRETLLLIKELLVDPLSAQMGEMKETSQQRHEQVMEKLADLDKRSLSAETAAKLRALTVEGRPDTDAGNASGFRQKIVQTVIRNPAAPWIAAMLVAVAGVILVVIVLSGQSVRGVIGNPSAHATPKE